MDERYERALRGVKWFEERDAARDIGEQGRSLTLTHGRRMPSATLLLHGLSASPRQFIAIAHALHERGHNVFVPRLPRHGYRDRLSEALATMNAAQLQACARDSLAIVQGMGATVAVAGFSLGGLLTAYIGQLEPVRRAVAISPFLGIAVIPDVFRLGIARWVLRRQNRFLWWDPFLRERQLPEHGYPRFATHAVAHSLTMAHDVIERAARQPPAAEELVLVLNSRDSAVNKRTILRLGRSWAMHKPEAVRIERLTNVPLFVHDIIEPQRYPAVARSVTPLLVDLIDGRSR